MQGGAVCRDVRPAAHLLSLTRQRKKAKKGDPTGCVPAADAPGPPAVLAGGMRGRTHCALARSVQTTSASQITMRVRAAPHPFTPPPARLGASRGACLGNSGRRCARTWLVRISMPLSPCREAQGLGRVWTPKDGRTACSDWLRLSERRAASAKRVPQRRPRSEHRRLPAGTRAVGSPFLCLLSFGDPKESRCAAGRTSRQTTPDLKTNPTTGQNGSGRTSSKIPL